MWTHELSTVWPVLVLIAVLFVWTSRSLRSEARRQREMLDKIEAAYERGYQHGRASVGED